MIQWKSIKLPIGAVNIKDRIILDYKHEEGQQKLA